MSQYEYHNQVGNKVQTTSEINMIRRMGLMSFCGAVTVADQHGCKYRKDASNTKHCMYWRESFEGACDCIFAQKNIDKPKPKVDDDEAE